MRTTAKHHVEQLREENAQLNIEIAAYRRQASRIVDLEITVASLQSQLKNLPAMIAEATALRGKNTALLAELAELRAKRIDELPCITVEQHGRKATALWFEGELFVVADCVFSHLSAKAIKRREFGAPREVGALTAPQKPNALELKRPLEWTVLSRSRVAEHWRAKSNLVAQALARVGKGGAS